ncbi:hypothetical protein [Sulfurovum sp.]|uniref:hypothetical protein n=1 Tax=Sulfurovum sp. TaxID=1969726 RepID=UPI003561933D
MRLFLIGLLFIIGIAIGIFWEKFQIQHNRWDNDQLIGLTVNEAIQVLGLPDVRYSMKGSLLWIENNQVLKVRYDPSNVINFVEATNRLFINNDINYKFSSMRLLELNNDCNLEAYKYNDTCEKRKKELEELLQKVKDNNVMHKIGKDL